MPCHVHLAPTRRHVPNPHRLAARVFETDCKSTLFFKTAPQLTPAEMSGALPTADALFDAASPAAFANTMGTAPAQPHSLRDLVSLLLHDAWPSELHVGLEYLPMLMFSTPPPSLPPSLPPRAT